MFPCVPLLPMPLRCGSGENWPRRQRSVLEADPLDFKALHALGLLRFGQQDYSGATAAMSRSLELKHQDPSLLRSRGGPRTVGRSRAGRIAVLQTLQLDPHLARAWNNLGNAQKACGRVDDARRAS